MKARHAGADLTVHFSRVYFEPRLGPVWDRRDLTAAHGAFVEDILCCGMLSDFAAVGRLAAAGAAADEFPAGTGAI